MDPQKSQDMSQRGEQNGVADSTLKLTLLWTPPMHNKVTELGVKAKALGEENTEPGMKDKDLGEVNTKMGMKAKDLGE